VLKGCRTIVAVAVVTATIAAPAVAAPPVTNTDDSGPGSLRNALTSASNGDTVSIPAGTYVLTSGPIQLSTNLKLVGEGEGQTTISGSGAHQIFTTAAGGPTETLRAMTLTGGNAATLGGAVRATGRLTLDHVEIANSHAGQAGGAVHASGRTLIVIDSTFMGDTAGGNGNAGSGGAIFFGGSTSSSGDGFTMKIDGSSFSQDTAGGGGGAGSGGAIHFAPAVAGTATDVSLDAELTGSTFSNDAAGGGGGVSFGGALFVGPTDSATNAGDSFSASLADDDFTGDAASPSGSGIGFGGGAGVFLGMSGQNDASSLSVTSTRFSRNTSSADAAGFGGGLNAQITGGLAHGSITGSTFAQNHAGSTTGSGGGLQLTLGNGSTGSVSVANSTLAGNQSGAPGGGASLSAAGAATIALGNDTVSGNTATGTGHGGGVSVSGPVTITNSIVAGNTGTSGTDCDGTPTSGGGNIESATSCGFNAAGDHQNAAAGLGPLQDSGGPALPGGAHLQTLAPLRGSPAIGGGLAAVCPGTDERGIARPLGAGCDIGAFEVTPPSVSTGATLDAQPAVADVSGSVVPGDVATAWSFEYGTTTAYGATTITQTLDPGPTEFSVQALLMDLRPGTTYHYRLVADNGGDRSVGADQTFTTGTPKTETPIAARPGSVRLISSTVAVKGGIVALRLSCSAPGSGCRGTARITVQRRRTVTRHGHKHKIVVTTMLGQAPFRIVAGTRATVSVHVGRVSQRTRALLLLRRSDRAPSSSRALVLTLPAPKRPRHR
jgi:hypothetical protein